MTIVGTWSEDEIRASYALNNEHILIGVAAVVTASVAFSLWGSQRKTELLTGLALSTLCITGYMCFVQLLASNMCVRAPLGVSIQGILSIPFVLGSKGTGLLALAATFIVADAFTIFVSDNATKSVRRLVATDFALLAVLCLLASGSYVAASLGVGVPL